MVTVRLPKTFMLFIVLVVITWILWPIFFRKNCRLLWLNSFSLLVTGNYELKIIKLTSVENQKERERIDLKPKIWWLDNMPGMLHWFFSRTRKSITLFAGRLTFMPPYHVGIPKQLVFVQLIKQNRLGRGCVPVSFLTAQSRVGRILPFSRCLIPSPDCLLVPVNISKVAILSELREIYTSWRPVIFLIITLWYTLITHY